MSFVKVVFHGCLLLTAGAVTLAGEPASAPGRAKYLLLDSRIINKTENAQLAVGRVTKHPANPLFKEDKPWERRFDNLYANVLFDQDERVYKCWYSPFIVDQAVSETPRGQWSQKPYRPRAREMGVCTPLQPYISTALGASEVRLLELAGAYCAIASGVLAEAHVIDRVTDVAGDGVYEGPGGGRAGEDRVGEGVDVGARVDEALAVEDDRGAEIAVAALVLNLLQLFYDIISAFLKASIPGGGIHQAHG